MIQFIKELIFLTKRKGIKHLINHLLLEISNKLELAHVYGQPTFIQIEPTTYCNSKCVMCYRTVYENKEKPKHMNFKNFKKIMSQFPYSSMTHIQGLGEPLLNLELPKMIKFCKDKRIFTSIITNATLLSEAVGKKLILNGLNLIEFSIDSADIKTFEKIRVGSKFSRVIDNIKKFVELKDKLKSKTADMDVSVTVVVSKKNVDGLPKLFNLIKFIGIKKVRIREVTRNESLQNLTPKELNLLLKHKEYGKSLGLDVDTNLTSLPPLKKKCWKIRKSTHITVDGWVTPCCCVPDKNQIGYGNILKQDFKQIWNNRLYQHSRIRLKNNPPKICRECTYGKI